MKFQIDIAPSVVPNDGLFTFHVWTTGGDRVASGYSDTEQSAREAAHEAARRSVTNPPLKEDFEYGE